MVTSPNRAAVSSSQRQGHPLAYVISQTFCSLTHECAPRSPHATHTTGSPGSTTNPCLCAPAWNIWLRRSTRKPRTVLHSYRQNPSRGILCLLVPDCSSTIMCSVSHNHIMPQTGCEPTTTLQHETSTDIHCKWPCARVFAYECSSTSSSHTKCRTARARREICDLVHTKPHVSRVNEAACAAKIHAFVRALARNVSPARRSFWR